MEEEYLFDDSQISDTQDEPIFVPSGTAEKNIKRKYKQRTVLHVWTDEECFLLIAAVEARRCLWDAGSVEYRLSSKESGWREVVGELGSSIQLTDAKSKWMNLRATFKTNISKARKTKSGQSACKEMKIHWRFFDALMFLEANDVAMSTQSISSMPSSTVTSDRSLLNDLGVAEPSQSNVGQRKQRNRGMPKTTSLQSSSASSSSTYKEMAAQALNNLKEVDQHTAFGDYIAAELRALKAADANALRQQIGSTVWTFLSTKLTLPPPSQPNELNVRQSINEDTIGSSDGFSTN